MKNQVIKSVIVLAALTFQFAAFAAPPENLDINCKKQAIDVALNITKNNYEGQVPAGYKADIDFKLEGEYGDMPIFVQFVNRHGALLNSSRGTESGYEVRMVPATCFVLSVTLMDKTTWDRQ